MARLQRLFREERHDSLALVHVATCPRRRRNTDVRVARDDERRRRVRAVAPASTTSRYMSTINGDVLYNDGCASGGVGRKRHRHTRLWPALVPERVVRHHPVRRGGTFASTGDIEFAAESFLRGYRACAPGDTFVRLAIGTSNYRGSTGSGHGAAWASLVDAVGAWIDSPPSYAAQETARGANDLEMGWN